MVVPHLVPPAVRLAFTKASTWENASGGDRQKVTAFGVSSVCAGSGLITHTHVLLWSYKS